jgi:hypothetical protein
MKSLPQLTPAKKPAFNSYKPPIIQKLDKHGGGPSKPSSSLLLRMGKREVDEEVVAVVAWALSFSSPEFREQVGCELLDDLGLEWQEMPMGGLTLQPKKEFRA